MKDYIVRGLVQSNNVRVFGVSSTASCKKGAKDHQCSPLASVAFGRAISAGIMMGAMLKGEERLTIQINGNGPIGTMMIDANANGNVKGFLSNPQATADVADVSKVVGNLGLLKVIKSNQLRHNFTGEVMLQTGQIGDDLSYYFYTSEQTPSIVVLSVNINKCGGIKCAGGMIVQVLPSASEEDLIEIENKVRSYGNFSEALNTKSIETIISEIFPDFVELSRNDVTYKCDCSKKKFTNIVKLVGIEELDDMIEKDHGCHAVCNFCNKEYNFTEEELIAIRDSIKK